MQKYDYWISSIWGVAIFVYIAFYYRFSVRLFCSRIIVLKLYCVSELQEDLPKETTNTADSWASPPEFLIPVSLGQAPKFAVLIHFLMLLLPLVQGPPFENHCYRISYDFSLCGCKYLSDLWFYVRVFYWWHCMCAPGKFTEWRLLGL